LGGRENEERKWGKKKSTFFFSPLLHFFPLKFFPLSLFPSFPSYPPFPFPFFKGKVKKEKEEGKKMKRKNVPTRANEGDGDLGGGGGQTGTRRVPGGPKSLPRPEVQLRAF